MTEQEWLTATEPGPMIRGALAEKVWERKPNLFQVACCRRAWHLLTDERSRQLLKVAERFADGNATEEDLEEATVAAQDAQSEAVESGLGPEHAHSVVLLLDIGNPEEVAWTVAACLADASDAGQKFGKDWTTLHQNEQRSQSRLLHDIFGNPFRPIDLDRSWLTQAATSLAQAIYDDRLLPSGLFDNQRMAILADALEEAGCDNADILDHLRGGGDHVRGCWVIDSILDKE
jgi:hypothetical protein